MNVSVRIHVEADIFLDHDVFPPTRPGESPCAWVSVGHEVNPPAEFATHDVEALERLGAERGEQRGGAAPARRQGAVGVFNDVLGAHGVQQQAFASV